MEHIVVLCGPLSFALRGRRPLRSSRPASAEAVPTGRCLTGRQHVTRESRWSVQAAALQPLSSLPHSFSCIIKKSLFEFSLFQMSVYF